MLTAVLAVTVASAQAAPPQAPDAYRGMRLYDSYCGRCHGETVHEREKGKVRDLADLRNQVARWSVHARHELTREEIEDIVAYLNRWHYHLGESS